MHFISHLLYILWLCLETETPLMLGKDHGLTKFEKPNHRMESPQHNRENNSVV